MSKKNTIAALALALAGLAAAPVALSADAPDKKPANAEQKNPCGPAKKQMQIPVGPPKRRLPIHVDQLTLVVQKSVNQPINFIALIKILNYLTSPVK